MGLMTSAVAFATQLRRCARSRVTRLLCVALLPVAVGPSYAAGVLGMVTGSATKYSDDAATCCARLVYPADGATELMRACKAKGGDYYKNARFTSTAACKVSRADP